MSEAKILVPEHITTEKTDRRGRFTLGKKFGGKRVTVAVVKVEDPDD